MLLSGRTAVVTGGSSGIGFAIARRLAGEGAQVAVVASTSLDKAQRCVDTIAAEGGAAAPFTANVGRASEVERLFAEVAEHFGSVDILVNSAGVFTRTPIGDSAEDDFDRLTDVNLKGVFLAMNAAVPRMRARGGGHIVNIASAAGIMPTPGYPLYCALKAGVMMLTRASAVELAHENIHVNAIAPGNTATPLNEAIRTAPEFEARRAWIARTTPSARLFTPAEEIAEAALFLVGPGANAMYGTTMVLDEGRASGVPADRT